LDLVELGVQTKVEALLEQHQFLIMVDQIQYLQLEVVEDLVEHQQMLNQADLVVVAVKEIPHLLLELLEHQVKDMLVEVEVAQQILAVVAELEVLVLPR